MARKTVTVTFDELYAKRGGPRLFRCHECRSLTDDPDGHAAWHATITLPKLGKAVADGTGDRAIPIDNRIVTVTVD